VTNPSSWALVPIPPGRKGPIAEGWNLRENCTLQEGWHGNVGLAHAYSGTCAIDIDDLDAATEWLAVRGVSLQPLLDAPDGVRISSGRPNRAKLLYRLDEPIVGRKVVIDKQNIIDFRCATSNGRSQQDVLPPSIHPDTKRPYSWELGVTGDTYDLPLLPQSLREIWMGLGRSVDAEPATRRGETLGAARALLDRIDASCSRDEWIEIGMALHHEFGQDGFELWDEWSQGSEKYKGGSDLKAPWKGFKADGAVGYGTLERRANIPSAAAFKVIDDEIEEINAALEDDGKFRLIPFQEFASAKSASWLVKGLLTTSGLAVVYGEPGCGKSFAVLDIAFHIARGLPWRGRRVKQGKVVYVCQEGRAGARQRFEALKRAYNVGDADIDMLVIADTPSLLGDDYKRVIKRIVGQNVALIIFDTLAQSIAGGDENASEVIGAALKACRRLERETGALVLLVHHSGKDITKGARGHSSLKGATDTELEVTRLGEIRQIRVTKQKDGADGGLESFQLRVVELGVDEYGEPITSMVVDPAIPQMIPERRLPRGAMQKTVYRVAGEVGQVTVDGLVKAVKVDAGDGPFKASNTRRAIEELIESAFLCVVDGVVVVA
jgi:hypothetical protein